MSYLSHRVVRIKWINDYVQSTWNTAQVVFITPSPFYRWGKQGTVSKQWPQNLITSRLVPECGLMQLLD